MSMAAATSNSMNKNNKIFIFQAFIIIKKRDLKDQKAVFLITWRKTSKYATICKKKVTREEELKSWQTRSKTFRFLCKALKARHYKVGSRMVFATMCHFTTQANSQQKFRIIIQSHRLHRLKLRAKRPLRNLKKDHHKFQRLKSNNLVQREA